MPPRERKLHDQYFKLAKAEGYAARSAYKLLQIQERRRIIRRGDRVLDIGCAPGSWMQVAVKITGPAGCVVGLDLQEVTIELPEHAIAIVGDAFRIATEDLAAGLQECGGGPGETRFDILLSDMAPNTTGAGDHFRSVALCRRVLEIAPKVLLPGGKLVMKVFEGEEYPALLKETGAIFYEAKGYKPQATREVSKEMYIIATGFSGGEPTKPAPPPGIARAQPKPAPGWGGGGNAAPAGADKNKRAGGKRS